MNNLDEETKEMLKVGLRSGILSVALASVRALLVSNESFRTTIKVWIAGIIGGTAAGMLCDLLDVGRTTTVVSLVVVAPFISSIWPVLEKWARRLTKRKTEEITDGDV